MKTRAISRVSALFFGTLLGTWTGQTVAAAKYEPVDFEIPAALVRFARQLFPTPVAPLGGPPLPTVTGPTQGRGVLLSDLFGMAGDSAQVETATTSGAAMLELSTVNTAGRTPGTFEVSATGEASYSIPIWSPPGARGIQPQLAISYSSGGPDDTMGPGWGLAGLSAIGRCSRTWVQDGTPSPVQLTTADRFCLDGNQLRLTSGTYGAAGSQYQPEIDTFSRITAYGTTGNGPTYFIAEGKDGLYYEFGNTTDSRALATGSTTPVAWLLNKVRDRQGNNMTVTYATTSGAIRPASINYTQTPATGAAYPYSITFAYQARVTNLSRFVGGAQIQQTQLLSSISVLSSGTLVRRYGLTYSTAPTTVRDRLVSVQECAGSTGTSCLAPTNITYVDGVAGVAAPATATGSGATVQGTQRTADFNGDGKLDLVFATQSGATYAWWVQFATAGGYAAPVSTGAVAAPTANVMFDDLLGENLVQVLAPSGGVWFAYRWNGSAFVGSSTGLAVVANLGAGQAALADGDGDGLPDLWTVPAPSPGAFTVTFRRNTSSGGVVSFAPTVGATYASSAVGTPPQLRGNHSFARSAVRHMDIDGDGRDDVLLGFSGPFFSIPRMKGLAVNGSSVVETGEFLGVFQTFMPVRWNDDACVDGAYAASPSFVAISKCQGASSSSVSLTAPPGQEQLLLDWDGDGRMDVLYPSGGVWQLQRSLSTSATAATSTGLAVGTGNWLVTDQNGDGLHDLGFADSAASYAIRFGLHNGPNAPADLVSSVVDGFGMSVSFNYLSIAHTGSCYVRDGPAPAFPKRSFLSPTYTVCSLVASTGHGATYQKSYSYYNANAHLQGRGILGFERRYSIDSRDGLVHMEAFNQDFPYIGATAYYLVRQSDWATKVKEVSTTFSALSNGTGFQSRSYPYPSQIVEDRFETGGTMDGHWITRTTTSMTVDGYGSPNVVTVNVVDQSAASPFAGESYTTTTTNTLSNDVPTWCLGRATQTTVQSTLPGGSSQTRTTSAVVDNANCRNTQEVIEPGSSTLRVTTTLGYDTSGNLNSSSVVGKNPDGTDMAARLTQWNYGTRRQFPESITNALGQTSTRTYNYALGKQASETDANGIGVSWTYDDFARRVQENRPDGTYTQWGYYFCDASNNYCGVADLRWYTVRWEYTNGGGLIRYDYNFFDGQNRLRYDERQNLSGGLDYHIQSYDSSGRLAAKYVPFSSGTPAYHVYSYDVVGRPTGDALYTGANVLDRQATIAYAGRATLSTDAKGNTVTRYTDVRGKLRRVVDPAPGGTTNYTWDHFGNLLTTVDPIGAGSSATYDVRGFKRTSYDSDMGSWSFTPNSLGEIVSQTDAKLQVTSFVYDLLGRLTSRTELEGTSTWTWGTSFAAKNIGKLQSVSGPGYSESYSFDSLGRPSTTTISADTTYQIDQSYNAQTGYLHSITYPTSTNGCRFVAQYGYSYGVANSITDASSAGTCGTTGTVLWQLIAQDARGLPIDEQLGNGVHILNGFDSDTGHLSWRTSGNNAQYNNHQNLTYQWDKNENLTERIDVNQGNLTEHFEYDSLDRLDRSTRNGVQNLDVTLDAAGNITYKSDVGSYTFNPIKRHAIDSTSNGWTFTYDSNGNMLTGRGATVAWSSFNLPTSITNGSIYSQFSYTPDRRYWRQIANYSNGTETTIYVGGLLEKVTGNGVTEYRHMMQAGTATIIRTRSTGSNNNTYYATQDQIGSSSVVTNSAGNVVVNLSFDAYGKRRGSTWSGTPSSGDYTSIAQTTRRGFTGHTMLDNLDLVHMNGRMYDAALGRFMSPDPIIQSIAESQSLNPYSYVWNNPLKYVDPTGYSIGNFLKKLVRFIIRELVRFVLNYLVPGLGDAALQLYDAGRAIKAKDYLSAFMSLKNFGKPPDSGGFGMPGSDRAGGMWDERVPIPGKSPGGTLGGVFGGLGGVVPIMNAAGADHEELPEVVVTGRRSTSWASFNRYLNYAIEGAGYALIAIDVLNTFISPTPDVGILGAGMITSARAARSGAGLVDDTARAAAGGQPNRIYSARELVRRGNEPGPYHNFPESFNSAIFNGNRQVISENYVLYTNRGTLNGVRGTYEIGVRPSASGRTEVITHRFFRPDAP